MTTPEQARRLAAIGYPQDRFPQLVLRNAGMWKRGPGAPWEERILLCHAYSPRDLISMAGTTFTYVTAMPETDALEWLETEKGWRWDRTSENLGCTWYACYRHDGRIALCADTASELLDKVLDAIDAAGMETAP